MTETKRIPAFNKESCTLCGLCLNQCKIFSYAHAINEN